jgi:hypothetical protein
VVNFSVVKECQDLDPTEGLGATPMAPGHDTRARDRDPQWESSQFIRCSCAYEVCSQHTESKSKLRISPAADSEPTHASSQEQELE